MGTLTDSLFTVLMSWVRGLVNALWALFSSDHTTALEFLGKHWLLIAAVLMMLAVFSGAFFIGQSRMPGFRWHRPVGAWLLAGFPSGAAFMAFHAQGSTGVVAALSK